MSATDSPIIDVDVGDSGGIQQLDHAVVGLPDGQFVITWVEFNTTNNTETIDGAIYNADGSISSDFVAGTLSGDPFLYGDVAALPNGQFIVAWQTYGQEDNAIHAQIFNGDGTTAVGEFSTGLLGTYPGLTALPNGDFVVVAPGASGLVGGVFSPTGSPIAGSGFSISASPQSFPKVIALPQGGFVVAWDQIPTNGQVDYYAEFFGSDGLPNSSGPIAIGSGSGASIVSAAALPDGNIVFTWGAYNNSPQVMGRVVSSNGTPLTSTFTVSSNLGLDTPTPVVTSLADGNFVIVWTTSSQNASGSYVDAVQGQLYTSGGSAIGSAFTINSSTTSDQEYYGYPNVAALADGRIVVDWESTLPSGLTNTYAQIVDLSVVSGNSALSVDISKAESEITSQFATGKQIYKSHQPVNYLADSNLVLSLAADIDPGGLNRDYKVNAQGYINPASLVQNFSNPDYDQCVALVLGLDPALAESTKDNTNNWREAAGSQVDLNGEYNPTLVAGDPIATFTSSGRYSGEHAGIFLGYGTENGEKGFFMLDQYVHQPLLALLGLPANQSAEVRFHAFNEDAKSYFVVAPAATAIA